MAFAPKELDLSKLAGWATLVCPDPKMVAGFFLEHDMRMP